jgi:hypothetical protein
MTTKPISSRRPAQAPTGCLVVFFSIFALVGASAFWFTTVKPVLARGFSPDYLIGLFPLVFLLIGGGGIVWALRAGRPASAAPLADPSSPFGIAAPAGGDAAPVELRPTATPLGKFVGLTFFTLFWNGIVSVFVVFDLQGWRNKAADGCLTAFLVPFVLVGLMMIFATVRQLLILFNPRVHLTLTPGTLTPGGMAYLQWRLTGRGAGVRRLRIVLEGKEEARYRRGTNTSTDHNTFATIAVADTTAAFEIPAGNARVDVPAEAVPSFTATHNKIIWSLKVACEIAGWPDSDDEYQVIVRPGFAGAA